MNDIVTPPQILQVRSVPCPKGQHTAVMRLWEYEFCTLKVVHCLRCGFYTDRWIDKK